MATGTGILAIDQGTTSSRAIVFDLDGAIVATAQAEFPQHFPADGWVEHDPADIWRTSRDVALEAFNRASAAGVEVAAIGLTNQRETTLVWERASGRPIHHAIVWQDRRTAAYCQALKADGAEADFHARTGLLLDPYFSMSKIAWLLDHVEGAREAAARGDLAFGTVDSFLLWHLTGGRVHATDVTNASRTGLFNLRTLDWDDELLRLFDVSRALLPEVRASAADFGASETRLFGRPLPIAGIAGDQQAAAIGQCCFQPGSVKSTYGTGCFLLLNTGREILSSGSRLLTTVAYRIGDETAYALEGSIFVAGAAIQWLRDGLGLIADAAESEALAQGLADNGGVYLVPAFTGLGAPHWDPDARGAIFGLTRGTSPAHLVRAALEAVAYQTHDLVAAMAADGVAPKALRVDGGMVANDWLVQFLADILDLPVERPRVRETTALGAAYLAGLQTGHFGSLDDLSARWGRDRRFTPALAAPERARLVKGWQDAVARVTTKG